MTTYSASNHYGIVDFFLLSIWVDTSHIAVPLEEHASEHGWLVSSHLLVCSRAGHAIIFKSQHIYRLLRTCNQDWQKRISCSGGHGTSIYQQNCGIHWWRGSTILTMQRQSFDTRRQHLYSEQNKIIQHYRANSSIAQIGSKEKHLCYSISCYIGLFLKSFWWFQCNR